MISTPAKTKRNGSGKTGGAAPGRESKTGSKTARTCLLVLGMHRSGTSALTRVLNLMGAALPENLLGAGTGNEAGHWEPEKLIELHDRLLYEAGSGWDDWRPFRPSELDRQKLDGFRARCIELLESEFNGAELFVLKEPRISRLVPFYSDILGEMNVAIGGVVTVRNPLSVAKSLAERNHTTTGYALIVWLRHALACEHATRTMPRVFVSYEHLMRDWKSVVQKIASRLDTPRWRSVEEISQEVEAFIRPDLQHHQEDGSFTLSDLDVPDWIKDAYSALTELQSDPYQQAAMAELDRVTAEFDRENGFIDDAVYLELRARRGEIEGYKRVLSRQAMEQKSEIESLRGERQILESEFAALRNQDQRHSEEMRSMRMEMEQVSADRDRLSQSLEKAQSDNARLRKQIEIRSDEIGSMRREMEQVSADRDRFSQSLDKALSQNAGLEGRNAELKNEIGRRQAVENQLRVTLAIIYASRSWKITAPLRKLNGVIRSVAKLWSSGKK